MKFKPSTAQRSRSETETFILVDLFSITVGIFQSLKLRILVGNPYDFS